MTAIFPRFLICKRFQDYDLTDGQKLNVSDRRIYKNSYLLKQISSSLNIGLSGVENMNMAFILTLLRFKVTSGVQLKRKSRNPKN